MQNIPKQILYPISNCPDRIKIKDEAIEVTIIRKLLVVLLCLGSIPKLAKRGLVIIPPPRPREEDTIPAIIAILTTKIVFFSILSIISDLNSGKAFFLV